MHLPHALMSQRTRVTVHPLINQVESTLLTGPIQEVLWRRSFLFLDSQIPA